MRGVVVDRYGFINRLLQLLGGSVDLKAYRLLDPPIESLDLPPTLRMIRSTENMFNFAAG